MNNLTTLRKKIDYVDKKILKLIDQRMGYVKKIGEIKKENNLPVIDKKREKEIIIKIEVQAQKNNISPVLVRKIWKAIFSESYIQEK